MEYAGFLKLGTKIEVLMYQASKQGMIITYDAKDNSVKSTHIDLLWAPNSIA